jgi:Stress responsive A/B Barrel Domain
MLIHIVSFKYRDGVDEATREDHRRRLQALATIEGVEELQVGADVVGSARSYDTGLMIRFGGRAALDAYQSDPRHVPVAQLGASLAQHIVAVDFETRQS